MSICIYIYYFLTDLPRQVQLKRMGQSQKNKNPTKEKRKRKKRINLRKENIIRRRKRRDERRKVHLLIVQTVLIVTEVLVFFCVHFCREDDFTFKSNLFMLCNAVVLKWDIYIFKKSIRIYQCFNLLNGPCGGKMSSSVSSLLVLNHASFHSFFIFILCSVMISCVWNPLH